MFLVPFRTNKMVMMTTLNLNYCRQSGECKIQDWQVWHAVM